MSPDHAAVVDGDVLDRESESPGRQRIDMPSFPDCPLTNPRRRRRPRLFRAAAHLIGEVGERRRVVAEDLDLDRTGAALEISEHVLQQLHELDFGVGHRGFELFAQSFNHLI